MAAYDFKTLFGEFIEQEWSSSATRAQRQLWLDLRDEARVRWARIHALRSRNQSYTDALLEGMLPYADTPANRARNRWVHPSSTLATDVRAWFEREGWTQPGEWPAAAYAVVQFVERCMLCPERLQEVCDRFVQHASARGFQITLVSPILNALVPDRFRVVTAASLAALRAFTGVPWSPRVETYPKANEALGAFVSSQRAVLECPATAGHRIDDVFDMFAGWFVAHTADARDEDWDRLQASTRDTRDMPCWKVTPGDQAPRWFRCLADQSVMLAWPELGDLGQMSREDFYARLKALAIEREEYRLGGVEHLWRIAHSPKAVLVAARGTSTVLGVGRVNGPYQYIQGERYPHRIPVDWFDTVERQVEQPEWSRPVVGLDLARVEEILEASLSDVYAAGEEVSGEVATQREPQALAASDSPRPLAAPAAPAAPVAVVHRETPHVRGVLPGPMMPAPVSRAPSAPAAPVSLAPAPQPPAPRLTTVPSPRMIDAFAPRKGSAAPRPYGRLAEETSYPEDELRAWVDSARRRGAAMFYGPPGTGKTHLALQLAQHLAGGEGIVVTLQLHAGYRYEDFIERAVDGVACVPGRFAEFVERARERAAPSVLLLDDLQRADTLRVMGEALHALEHRDRVVRLASGSDLAVPRSVVVLATLNTTERPLGALDASVRRLFASFPVPARYDVLVRYHAARNFDASGLVATLQSIARAVGHPDLAVGPASFFVDDLGDCLEDIWRSEVEPHLAQHLGDRDLVATFRWDRVRAALLDVR